MCEKTNKFRLTNYLYSIPWLLMLFMVTFSKNNPDLSGVIGEPDYFDKSIIIFTYTISLIFLFINFKTILSILKGRWLYIFFLLYVTVSTSWSEDPSSTLRISAYFWGGGVICLLAVVAYKQDTQRFFQSLILYSILMVCGSLITVFLNPVRGIAESGRWIGLATHANILGIVCIISIWANISYSCITKSKLIKILNILMIFSSAVCLYGADSASSIVLSVYIIVLTIVSRLLNIENFTKMFAQISWLVFPIILSIFILYVINPEVFGIENFFGMVGRKTTFTGRTELWKLAMIKIYQHPIIGSGFQEFISVSGMKIKHFHNGYLELLVRGGIVALMFVITFIFQLVFSLKKRVSDPKLFLFFSIIISAILLHNVTEGSFGRGVTAFWLVFSFIYFYEKNEGGSKRIIGTLPISTKSTDDNSDSCHPILSR